MGNLVFICRFKDNLTGEEWETHVLVTNFRHGKDIPIEEMAMLENDIVRNLADMQQVDEGHHSMSYCLNEDALARIKEDLKLRPRH